jgi:hypothetical protein
MAQQYPIDTIKQLKQKLQTLPPLPATKLTLDEVAQELKEAILSLDSKNYTSKDIAEIIIKDGVKLTQTKIKAIINSSKKSAKKTKRKT